MAKIKEGKGITLVALIITIIVLLILATVSIRLIINNGIISKNKQAVDIYVTEEEKEQIQLAYNEYQMKRILDNNAQLTLDSNIATIESKGINGWSIEFIKTKNKYNLSVDGKIDIINSGNENNYEDSNGLFSFYIDGTKYHAARKMNWKRWISSEYNINSFVLNENQICNSSGNKLRLNFDNDEIPYEYYIYCDELVSNKYSYTFSEYVGGASTKYTWDNYYISKVEDSNGNEVTGLNITQETDMTSKLKEKIEEFGWEATLSEERIYESVSNVGEFYDYNLDSEDEKIIPITINGYNDDYGKLTVTLECVQPFLKSEYPPYIAIYTFDDDLSEYATGSYEFNYESSIVQGNIDNNGKLIFELNEDIISKMKDAISIGFAILTR